jgi:hypothetical protein
MNGWKPLQFGRNDMKKKHPGFAKVQQGIEEKEGYSKEQAGAILASAARKASPAAKKSNPRLKKVDMAKKK